MKPRIYLNGRDFAARPYQGNGRDAAGYGRTSFRRRAFAIPSLGWAFCMVVMLIGGARFAGLW